MTDPNDAYDYWRNKICKQQEQLALNSYFTPLAFGTIIIGLYKLATLTPIVVMFAANGQSLNPHMHRHFRLEQTIDFN